MRSSPLIASRVLRAGAAFGFALTLSTVGTAAAHAAPADGTTCNKHGTVTWQNNHNGRYLEVRNNDTSPGANVDSAPWTCSPAQMWISIDDGAINFGPPVGAADGFTFDNYFNGYCAQDPGRDDAHVYTEPCVFGPEQTFAEYGGSNGYELMTGGGGEDEICEAYTNSTDWAIIIPGGYPGFGTDKCEWH